MQSENAVGPRLKRISNALDRKRTLDLEDLDLTSSQGMVLGWLVRRQEAPVNPGEIGRHFGLSHPTVTGILQRLEAKDFIRYAGDSGDRRKKRVIVTEKALDVHQRVVQRFQVRADLCGGCFGGIQAGLVQVGDQCCKGDGRFRFRGFGCFRAGRAGAEAYAQKDSQQFFHGSSPALSGT